MKPSLIKIITEKILECNKISEISKKLKIPYTSIQYWAQKIKNGEDLYPPETRGRPPKIKEKQEKAIILLIKIFPTLTLNKIINMLHLNISESTLSRFLNRKGITKKKLKIINYNRTTEKYKNNIINYFEQLKSAYEQGYYSEIISIDESSFTKNLFPDTGWSFKGVSPGVVRKFSSERRKTLIGAVSMSGNIRFLKSVNGGAKSSDFLMFCEELFEMLPDGALVLTDNAAIHKSFAVREFFSKNKRIRVIFIPPYTPEFAPIEMVWRKLKCKIKNVFMFNRSFDNLLYMANNFIKMFENDFFENIFKHSFKEMRKNYEYFCK